MSIEEKKRALEFIFTPDNIPGNLQYEIIYDDSKSPFSLSIFVGGNGIEYPLDLFVDVVDFLTSKGVIRPKVSYRESDTNSYPKSGLVTKMNQGSIPLPRIETKEMIKDPIFSGNIDPLASFDITIQGNSLDIVQLPKITTPPMPTIIRAAQPEIPSVVSNVVSNSTKNAVSKEIINRPVIRTRVKDGDPQSAEKEAEALRKSVGQGKGKVVRSSHKAE